MLDVTVLAPQATYQDIGSLCEEALKHDVWAVCVNPIHIERAGYHLRGSNTRVCSVVGFPLGANRTATKVMEARQALEDGASELDMVMNVGAYMAGDWATAENDIKAVVRETQGKIVKVIIEITLLSDEEIAGAARLVSSTGAGFVKTQTGWVQTRNTTADDIRRIREAIAPGVKIKASGGTRSWEAVRSLLNAGADRFGVRVQDVEGILAAAERE
jgi:deoxyribose-phosphate aldolase